MEICYSDWRRFDDKLDSILSTINTNQGNIMSAFDDLQQVVSDVVTSQGNLSTEVGKFPGLVDAMEARITAAIKKIVTPAQMQQVTDAVASLRTVAQANADAAAAAAKAAADALDEIDEADVVTPPPPPPPTATLADSFPSPSQPAFNDAAAAYAAAGGADTVRLDGIQLGNNGTSGVTKDYYSHRATGEINTTPPTD